MATGACCVTMFLSFCRLLGLPDVGLISYGEMIDQGRLITEAVSIPVIGDADNGYGNCMNVKRTVKGFINAGFAGIILEDQVSPKACGHTQGRKVVSREEAIMHIKAAVDARKESGSDIVIVARTDSRQALSLDEALWRARAFADAGADVLFIDALASREEMMAFCAVSPGVPKMANMLEGGGKTPILSPLELEEIGYKIIAYPLSLIGVSMRAMEDALVAIKGGRIPPPSSLPSFEEIKDTLGFNRYYEEEKRYVASPAQSSFGSGNYDYTTEASSSGDTKSRTEKSQEPIIDILPQLYDPGSAGGRGPSSGMWSRTLRLKITGRDGVQKIDARIPAGFLEGMTKVIPGLAGTNIMERLRNAPMDSDNPQNGQILLDFEDGMGDRIQVFIADPMGRARGAKSADRMTGTAVAERRRRRMNLGKKKRNGGQNSFSLDFRPDHGGDSGWDLGDSRGGVLLPPRGAAAGSSATLPGSGDPHHCHCRRHADGDSGSRLASARSPRNSKTVTEAEKNGLCLIPALVRGMLDKAMFLFGFINLLGDIEAKQVCNVIEYSLCTIIVSKKRLILCYRGWDGSRKTLTCPNGMRVKEMSHGEEEWVLGHCGKGEKDKGHQYSGRVNQMHALLDI
ncbi:2,3-dimethylmalate lyase [Triticum urartu]|uniref:2,3-dimethylmalate lyase n=1 Tax=Triticum urartu TaxID=4572 RepID=M7ZHR1_TRIUA|nr:2,3-dimethylmalate lyase [Triticum urartu]